MNEHKDVTSAPDNPSLCILNNNYQPEYEKIRRIDRSVLKLCKTTVGLVILIGNGNDAVYQHCTCWICARSHEVLLLLHNYLPNTKSYLCQIPRLTSAKYQDLPLPNTKT